jgi:hypothetical protein
MFRWLTARVRRDRRQLTDKELAEQEAIRREAEQERIRAEARMAEERAALDAHNRGSGYGW